MTTTASDSKSAGGASELKKGTLATLLAPPPDIKTQIANRSQDEAELEREQLLEPTGADDEQSDEKTQDSNDEGDEEDGQDHRGDGEGDEQEDAQEELETKKRVWPSRTFWDSFMGAALGGFLSTLLTRYLFCV